TIFRIELIQTLLQTLVSGLGFNSLAGVDHLIVRRGLGAALRQDEWRWIVVRQREQDVWTGQTLAPDVAAHGVKVTGWVLGRDLRSFAQTPGHAIDRFVSHFIGTRRATRREESEQGAAEIKVRQRRAFTVWTEEGEQTVERCKGQAVIYLETIDETFDHTTLKNDGHLKAMGAPRQGTFTLR